MSPGAGVKAGAVGPTPGGGSALTPVRTTSPFGVRGREGKDRGVEAEVSVSLRDAWSRLICAGWLPQDRVFGWSVARV
jgi:hypothetical protein